jgi:hypothetical protein
MRLAPSCLVLLTFACQTTSRSNEEQAEQKKEEVQTQPAGNCSMTDRGDGTTFLKCEDGTQMLVSGGKGDKCAPGTRATCAFTADEVAIDFPKLNKGHPLPPCRLGLRECGADGTWGSCQGASIPRAPNTCRQTDCDCDGVED